MRPSVVVPAAVGHPTLGRCLGAVRRASEAPEDRRGSPRWPSAARCRRRSTSARASGRAPSPLVCVGALAARRPALAAAALAGGVALNADLYGTVRQRLGARGVAAAIPLHLLHQLVGAAAVPAGLVSSMTRRTGGQGK